MADKTVASHVNEWQRDDQEEEEENEEEENEEYWRCLRHYLKGVSYCFTLESSRHSSSHVLLAVGLIQRLRSLHFTFSWFVDFFQSQFPQRTRGTWPEIFHLFFHFPYRTLSHLKMRTTKHLEWFHFLSKISMGFLFRDKLSFFFGIRPWTHDSTPWISFSPFLGFQFGG